MSSLRRTIKRVIDRKFTGKYRWSTKGNRKFRRTKKKEK